METAITTAKNQFYKLMTLEEKKAFVEAVCMYACDYLTKSSSSPTTKNYFSYWAENVLKLDSLSNSEYLNRYYYFVKDGECHLAVVDDQGSFVFLCYNVKELKLFVHNVVNDVPIHSPIVEAINKGKKKFELVRDGINSLSYGSLTDIKTKRPRKNSLRQRIMNGEITRYEAYEKNKRKKKLN